MAALATGTGLTALKLAIGNSDQLLLPFQEVCSQSKELVDRVLSQIEGLFREEAELTTECRIACKSVSKAVTKACFYIDKVNDFVWCAQQEQEINEVKARVRNGDLKPLLYLLRRLKQHLTKATNLCGEFQTACEEAEESCNRASTECANNNRKARLRKTVVQVGGGTAAAGMIAAGAGTGVALSIVAGVFTFGVGTIVGLSLTAAGTATAGAVVGTATAFGTAMAANHFAALAQRFGDLGTNFNSISSIASGLCEAVEKIEFQLERAAEEMGNIDYCRDHKMLDDICKALDNLSSKCDGLYKKTRVESESLKEQQSLLKKKAEALCCLTS